MTNVQITMLKAIQLGQQLTKKEMKELKGRSYPIGTCAAIDSKGNIIDVTNLATAKDWASGGGHWCCDSCSKATWLVSMD